MAVCSPLGRCTQTYVAAFRAGPALLGVGGTRVGQTTAIAGAAVATATPDSVDGRVRVHVTGRSGP